MINVQKSDLKKMSGCVCVCVYACVCACKRSRVRVCALPLVSLSLKLIHGLTFYDDLNILRNVCNRSSCRKF